MSKKVTVDPAAQAQNIASAQQESNALRLTTLGQAQRALQQRATALAQAAKLPRAPKALQARSTRYQDLATALGNARLSSVRLPQPAAGSFILHGQVVSAAGKAQPDLSVSLTDPKGIVNARVPAVKTDASGYFTITLRAAEFPDLAAASQLFVSVTDAKQQEVAKPAQAIVFQPGKVAIMPIVT